MSRRRGNVKKHGMDDSGFMKEQEQWKKKSKRWKLMNDRGVVLSNIFNFFSFI